MMAEAALVDLARDKKKASMTLAWKMPGEPGTRAELIDDLSYQFIFHART